VGTPYEHETHQKGPRDTPKFDLVAEPDDDEGFRDAREFIEDHENQENQLMEDEECHEELEVPCVTPNREEGERPDVTFYTCNDGGA
jgi:hypothetical protein